MSDGTDALGKGRHDGVKTYVLENGLRECGKKGNGMTFSSTVLPSLHYNLEEDSIALKNVPSRFLTHSKETRLK